MCKKAFGGVGIEAVDFHDGDVTRYVQVVGDEFDLIEALVRMYPHAALYHHKTKF